MKSIAIFYASVGTGHRSAAEALRDQFIESVPDGYVLCKDILEYTPTFLRSFISKTYLFMVKHAPWMWGMLYCGSDKTSLSSFCFDKIHTVLCKFFLPKIVTELSKQPIDAIFFTHFFGALPLVRKGGKIPIFYVNTDFLCHKFQISGEFKTTFVASALAKNQHLDKNIHNVVYTGIPIPPKYNTLISKQEARKKLGFEGEDKIVLISGGGIGASSIYSVTKALAPYKNIKFVVICGNNNTLYKKLTAELKGYTNVFILKFIKNIEDYYVAADLGIIKPGGLSLSEALAAQLPLLLMTPIPGQEKLNFDYLSKEGVVEVLENMEEIYKKVDRMLYEPGSLDEMRLKIKFFSRPYAARDILEKAREQIMDTRKQENSTFNKNS
ncbi:MAG: glycosyltransferase [Synergistaceae bacterium]|jgi:processive 1,2-diacylglycerol beta-glucosyltransferase|nr:glycosyltransferase [Synergistaceae bacterium]